MFSTAQITSRYVFYGVVFKSACIQIYLTKRYLFNTAPQFLYNCLVKSFMRFIRWTYNHINSWWINNQIITQDQRNELNLTLLSHNVSTKVALKWVGSCGWFGSCVNIPEILHYGHICVSMNFPELRSGLFLQCFPALADCIRSVFCIWAIFIFFNTSISFVVVSAWYPSPLFTDNIHIG